MVELARARSADYLALGSNLLLQRALLALLKENVASTTQFLLSNFIIQTDRKGLTEELLSCHVHELLPNSLCSIVLRCF
jgi:hypothetical protein